VALFIIEPSFSSSAFDVVEKQQQGALRAGILIHIDIGKKRLSPFSPFALMVKTGRVRQKKGKSFDS